MELLRSLRDDLDPIIPLQVSQPINDHFTVDKPDSRGVIEHFHHDHLRGDDVERVETRRERTLVQLIAAKEHADPVSGVGEDGSHQSSTFGWP